MALHETLELATSSLALFCNSVPIYEQVHPDPMLGMLGLGDLLYLFEQYSISHELYHCILCRETRVEVGMHVAMRTSSYL